VTAAEPEEVRKEVFKYRQASAAVSTNGSASSEAIALWMEPCTQMYFEQRLQAEIRHCLWLSNEKWKYCTSNSNSRQCFQRLLHGKAEARGSGPSVVILDGPDHPMQLLAKSMDEHVASTAGE
jgi:hypothetical protein